jgi:hypothetical protein
LIRISPILLLLFSCVAFSQQTASKKYTLKKTTLTSVGSTTIYNLNNKYTIYQSVGQSGIIGTVKTAKNIVQQGFLTNNFLFRIDNEKDDFKETLSFVISPNPFKDHIKIDFSKIPKHEILIRIFDVTGKSYFTKTYQPKSTIIIPLQRYSVGTYLIDIKSGKNSSTNKIIKVD